MNQEIFQNRRQRFLDAMEEGIAILPAAPEANRNGDNDYLYRQDSDLLYLTGFEEPETIAVLRPGAEARLVLFVRPRDPAKEVWTGRRAGVEGVKARFGADEAHPIEQFDEMLPELLKGHSKLFYRMGRHASLDRRINEALDGLRAKNRDGVLLPEAVVDPGPILHEHRLRKGPDEIERMRRAASISAEAHRTAMRCTRPGMNERELQAVIEYVFLKRGGDYTAYPSIVAAGANACILHYNENDAPMEAGRLVLVDAGVEYAGYAGDITRTWPVSGTFSEAQRAVYDVVLDAQVKAVEASAPGVKFHHIHDVAVRALTEGMVKLGLLSGDVDTLIAEETYKKYYLHRTGHWIGMDVHDVGRYFAGEGASRVLEPGMVMTVEPGLYIAEDDADAPEHLRGIGVRIEDDILITEDGYENLTAEVPKKPEEIEALMAEPAELPL